MGCVQSARCIMDSAAYANGTDATGMMNEQGLSLLKEMERLNMILDVTHLCDDAFWQAIDYFHGHVWASHNNCRAFRGTGRSRLTRSSWVGSLYRMMLPLLTWRVCGRYSCA